MGYLRNRIILYIVFICSFIVMLSDIILFAVVEQELIYIAANGILVFRLFGVWLIPWIIHVGCAIFLVYYFAFIKWEFVNLFNTILMAIPVFIVAITALHLVFFRPGRNVNQRACRAGIHALLAIVLMFNFYWGIVFLICDNNEQGVLEMVYFFLFLYMILNPKFLEKSQIAAIAQAEADAEVERREARREADRRERLLQQQQQNNETSRPEGGQDYTEAQRPRNRR